MGCLNNLILILAEYNLDTRKFERFLKLGANFVFGDKYILYTYDQLIFSGDLPKAKFFVATKDLKDPLNRFDGLFNGRTYNDGKFVLIRKFRNEDCYEDDIVYYDDKITSHKGKPELIKWNIDDCDFENSSIGSWCEDCGSLNWSQGLKILGNLHEDPKLYKTI